VNGELATEFTAIPELRASARRAEAEHGGDNATGLARLGRAAGLAAPPQPTVTRLTPSANVARLTAGARSRALRAVRTVMAAAMARAQLVIRRWCSSIR